MKLGLLNFDLSLITQIINTLLLAGVVYLLYYYMVKLPKRIKTLEAKIEKIESKL